MLYVKNVPGWERVVRVLAGAGGAAAALWLMPGGSGWLLAAGAAGFAMSGLFGFCPACAMVGRRLK